MTGLSYRSFARMLRTRLEAACPGVQFQVGGSWNDKAAIAASLVFPRGATEAQRATCRDLVHSFEGFFDQAQQ